MADHRRVGERRVAVDRRRARRALSRVAVAGVAVIVAAVASGLLAPTVLRGLGDADAAERAFMLSALHYTGLLNQAFAAVYVVLSAIAILLWSSAVLAGRELSRGLGYYGLVLGALLIFGVLSGHLRLGIHGFGLIVIGQGVWMVWAAVLLWRGARS